MNEPRMPIHPQPSFNDVRRLQDQLIQAGARLLPANEKLYEENIKLRKVVSISSARAPTRSPTSSWRGP